VFLDKKMMIALRIAIAWDQQDFFFILFYAFRAARVRLCNSIAPLRSGCVILSKIQISMRSSNY